MEILSLKAVRRPDVVAELYVLLGSLGDISEGSTFVGGPFLTLAPRRRNVADLLIKQINQAIVEDHGAQEPNVLV